MSNSSQTQSAQQESISVRHPNEQLADDAVSALRHYHNITELQGESVNAVMIELMKGLRHVCDRHGITFHRLLNQVTRAYQNDVNSGTLGMEATCKRQGNALDTFR